MESSVRVVKKIWNLIPVFADDFVIAHCAYTRNMSSTFITRDKHNIFKWIAEEQLCAYKYVFYPSETVTCTWNVGQDFWMHNNGLAL